MIETIFYAFWILLAGALGYVICALINSAEKERASARCIELESALDDAGRTLLCHGYRRDATKAMKALGRPVLEDGRC